MGTKSFTADDPALPMNYPSYVFRTLVEEGFHADEIFAGTSIDKNHLDDPDFRADFRSISRLFQNGIALTGEPDLGPKLARKFQPTAIGLPAFTAMSAATFQDGLRTLERFLFLTFSTVEFTVHTAPKTEPYIAFRPRLDHGPINTFIFSSALVLTERLCQSMLGADRVATRADLALPKPIDWGKTDIGLTVRFEAAEHRLYLPQNAIHKPLPGADPITHKRLLTICKRLAAQITSETTAYAQLIDYLKDHQDLGVSMAEASAAIGYSERALRRQLHRSGTSYRQVLDQTRATRARWMLAHTAEPVQTIAFQLGFDTASNFTRSFKRWTGSTPRTFRNNQRLDEHGGQK